jgi:hypothetical protein
MGVNVEDVNNILHVIRDTYTKTKYWYRKILATEEGYHEFLNYFMNQISKQLSKYGMKVTKIIYGDQHDLIFYFGDKMDEYKIKIDTENDLIKIQ